MNTVSLIDLFLFFENSDIVNYADDNSPFACETVNSSILQQLDKDSKTLLGWIRSNGLKAVDMALKL